jgi:hypothetical protein
LDEGKFAKIMARPKPEDTKSILYGAIAACQSWSFTTDRVPFCIVIEELKDEAVPDRFRSGIEAFVSYNDPNLPASDETDRVFRELGWGGDGLGYIFDDRRGGMAPFCGLRFIWEDKPASQYAQEQGFTGDELDWLFAVSLRLHTFEGSVPEKRAALFEGGR